MARLETAARTSDVDAYLDLLADDADRMAARAFAADALRREVWEAAARARFVRPLDDVPEGSGYELTVEVFTERGVAGRLQTWTIDVVRDAGGGDGPNAWRIADQERVDVVEGLLNLTLNPDVAYDAANLVIAGEDMTLHMTRGTVFVAETGRGGVTAMVLLGDGVLTFSPAPEAERGQVRLLAGRETLEAGLSAAFVRVNPATIASRVSTTDLNQRPVSRNALERAREIFDRFAPLSFGIDLGRPERQALVADARRRRLHRRHDHRSLRRPDLRAAPPTSPRDVSLFERDGQRIIALYPSAGKRAARGPVLQRRRRRRVRRARLPDRGVVPTRRRGAHIPAGAAAPARLLHHRPGPAGHPRHRIRT